MIRNMSIHTKRSVAFAHYVDGDTKCANLHGHNWDIEVWVDGEIWFEDGMLLDFNIIKKVIDELDHTIVVPEKSVSETESEIYIKTSKGNIVLDADFEIFYFPYDFVTAEYLSQYFAEMIADSTCCGNINKITVRVYESKDSYATSVWVKDND